MHIHNTFNVKKYMLQLHLLVLKLYAVFKVVHIDPFIILPKPKFIPPLVLLASSNATNKRSNLLSTPTTSISFEFTHCGMMCGETRRIRIMIDNLGSLSRVSTPMDCENIRLGVWGILEVL